MALEVEAVSSINHRVADNETLFDPQPDKDRRYSRKISQLSTTGLSMAIIKPGVHDEESNKITFSQACMTMILSSVSSGILFFSKSMADVGVVAAPLLCLLLAVVCVEAGTLIAGACSLAEEWTRVEISSYEELARFVGGVKMERALVITKNVAMLGFIIVFFGLTADSIATFFPQPVSNTTLMLIKFVIVYPMYALLAMLKDLKSIARFAVLGIFAIAIEVTLLVGASFMVAVSAEDCLNGDRGSDCRWFAIAPPTDTPSEALPRLGKAMSIFLFSYAILATVPSIRSQLKDRSQMPSILRVAFAFCASLNILIMCMGYWAFGGNAQDNLNDGLSQYYPGIARVVAVMIILNLLLSTPLFSYCVISVFEATGTDALRTPLTPPNIAFRAGLVLALGTMNHFLPYAMEVIGLVSSVFCVANNIVFPVVFFYLARKLIKPEVNSESQASVVHISVSRFLFHGFILAIGCCVLVFGVEGSLNSLLEKIAESES